MQTARRIYVYLICGVTLGMAVAGMRSLLGLLLDAIGLSGPVLIASGDAAGELSAALALLGVGAPVFAIHWGFAQRGLVPGRPHAEEERRSAVRALYLTLVLLSLLALAALAGFNLIQDTIGPALGEDYFGERRSRSVAAVVVFGLAWAYHVRVRRRDLSAGAVLGAAAWLPRAYLYLAALGGGSALLLGANRLIEVFAMATFGGRQLADFGPSSSIAALVLGAMVWGGHAGYASFVLRDPGWRGVAERASKLRLAYYVAVLVGTAGAAVQQFGDALQPLIAGALGGAIGEPDAAILVAVNVVNGAVFGGAGIIHLRWLRAEAAGSGTPDRPAHAWALERYALAVTGLAFASLAAARLVGIAIESTLGSRQVVIDSGGRAFDIGLFVPLTLLGGTLWLWEWRAAQRRWLANRGSDATSPVRRASLLLVLAASVIAAVVSVALILYRLFGFLLGAELTGNPLGELSTPLGFLVVGGGLAVYHGLTLRSDAAAAPAAARDAAEVEAAAWEDEGGPVLPGGAIALTLRGPDGPDLEAALGVARAALPEGYRLERD